MLTPAHQFPLGMALTTDRRRALVAWARRTGGIVVEDDYDGKFRYDRRPRGALQGEAPAHVAYVGSASKALAPGLRIGWLVLPKALRAEVLAQKGELETSSAILEQLTLARFVADGGYDRHVRARRLAYAARRRQVVAQVGRHCPGVELVGMQAGLHLTALLDPRLPTDHVDARWAELGLTPLEYFRHPDAVVRRAGVVFGFGAASDSAFPSALAALVELLAD